MSNSLCKTSVYKAYHDVISDVITNVREHFIEDGVDETVLQELKQLWETKLAATKAVDENKEPDKVAGLPNKSSKQEYSNGNVFGKGVRPILQQQLQMQQHPQQQMLQNKQQARLIPPNNNVPHTDQSFPEWRRVPIQLTIPCAPGVGDGHRILSIDVPEVFLQGQHLKQILTGQVISTTMGLPLMTACAFLQEQVNAAFLKYQQSFFGMTNVAVHPSVVQPEPGFQGQENVQNNQNGQNIHHIPQADGPVDSSDDEEDEGSEEGSDNDLHDDKMEEEIEHGSPEGVEDEPLNSEDDVSDADGTEESFETDNVIVCQYDKITRSRNRWKFHLKDGIMNLKGEDFIFQKANGDAEW